MGGGNVSGSGQEKKREGKKGKGRQRRFRKRDNAGREGYKGGHKVGRSWRKGLRGRRTQSENVNNFGTENAIYYGSILSVPKRSWEDLRKWLRVGQNRE